MVPPANIGAMRLPRDLTEAVELVRHAIDSGMKYIDTSRGYGESEWILGEALKDGYREKVILSTKWSAWITKIQNADDTSGDCVRRRIDEEMRRLDVDYLDFYQVWNIDSREHYNQIIAKGGVIDGILKAKEEGLVGHLGFTTHDSVENILAYINEADWCEIILLTYNMMNRQYGPAIEAAYRKGIGTLVMNPVGGGRLGGASPVLGALAEEVGAESAPELAIRYVLSNPNVVSVLCGMTRLSDVDSTIRAAGKPAFTADQMARIESFLGEVDGRRAGFCTGCRYCVPCPNGIDIPAVMACVFDHRNWGLTMAAKHVYNSMRVKPDVCEACGKCEAKCTQKLKISEEMAFAVRELAAK